MEDWSVFSNNYHGAMELVVGHVTQGIITKKNCIIYKQWKRITFIVRLLNTGHISDLVLERSIGSTYTLVCIEKPQKPQQQTQ